MCVCRVVVLTVSSLAVGTSSQVAASVVTMVTREEAGVPGAVGYEARSDGGGDDDVVVVVVVLSSPKMSYVPHGLVTLSLGRSGLAGCFAWER